MPINRRTRRSIRQTTRRTLTTNQTLGAQHREFQKEILRAMQVGVRLPTQRISIRNPTGNASRDKGPNIKNFKRNPTSNVDLDENSIPLTKVKNLDIKS